jgi:predicted porin
VQFGTQEGIFEAVGYNIDPFHGAAGNGGNIVNILGTTALAGANAVCNGNNLGCRRLDQTITYSSPNFSGFTFQIDYTLEGGPAATGLNKPSELQYGAAYSGKIGDAWGLRGSLAGIQVKNSGLLNGVTGIIVGQDEKDDGVRGTIGVTFGDFSVDLLLEQLKWKDNVNAVEAKVQHTWIGGSWNVPTGKVALGYTKAGKTKVNGTDLANTDADHMAIGYYHNLSKNSAAYVIYSAITNKDNAQYNMQDGATSAAGKDPSSIGVGMYYLF